MSEVGLFHHYLLDFTVQSLLELNNFFQDNF